MKKLLIIYIALLCLFACEKKSDIAQGEEVKTPAHTIEVMPTPDVIEFKGFEEISYTEDTENGTTITLKDETHFETVLNVCTGFVTLNGEYFVENDVLTLNFPEETGFFIDDEQPYSFKIGESTLEILENKSFSCAMVDKYSVVK